MFEAIDALLDEVKAFKIESKADLENFRLAYLSKKSPLNDLFAQMKVVPNEQKKEFGQRVNLLKDSAQDKFKEMSAAFEALEENQSEMGPNADLTLPVVPNALGSIHPISQVRRRIVEIFERIGFNLSEGPEIEDDWHNFTALNFPENHPARDMQDTFFVEKANEIALRTHTSSVQVRVMESQKPPIRTLSVGRVYRNETISARAHCQFHQFEGLYINKGVSFKDLKDTLYYFAKEMFGKDTKVRFRPSFFPFTEPSAEVDISCFVCKGKGCNICKHSGWVEIGGSGMVHPNVLKNNGIDPNEYTGFAFGMGIERITMLKYEIKDIRLFTENDLRFLRQFPLSV